MRIPTWLSLLLLFLWTLWFSWYFVCKRCNCCGEVAAVPTSGIPFFTKDSCKVHTNALTQNWRQKVLGEGHIGDTLVIEGWASEKEMNTCGGTSLGIARAEALKQFFQPEIPAGNIICLDGPLPDSVSIVDPYYAFRYSWRQQIAKADETTIIQTADSIVIRFPYNSSIRHRDAKVEAFLDELCKLHKQDTMQFKITGHTDDVGDGAVNDRLGLQRANSLKKVMQACGIQKNRISTLSKGETSPVADNTTPEGRQLNRRVVIHTIAN